MEKCFEYFNCRQTTCPAYQWEELKNCWEYSNTLCNHPTLEKIVEYHKNKCHYCQYYKAGNIRFR